MPTRSAYAVAGRVGDLVACLHEMQREGDPAVRRHLEQATRVVLRGRASGT